MISREEFDAEMAERDRRAEARAAEYTARADAFDAEMARMNRREQARGVAWNQLFARLDKTMTRLDATMAKLGETLTAQGGAYALLWADYLRHKNEHDGGPAA